MHAQPALIMRLIDTWIHKTDVPLAMFKEKNDIKIQYMRDENIDSLVQYCSISSALAMEILQSCTSPSI